MNKDSFLRNCLLQSRPGEEPLFEEGADGRFAARIDGYAVIPVERLRELEALEQAQKG